MDKSGALMLLTFVTFVAGLAFAGYEIWAVDKVKKTGEHMDGSQDKPKG